MFRLSHPAETMWLDCGTSACILETSRFYGYSVLVPCANLVSSKAMHTPPNHKGQKSDLVSRSGCLASTQDRRVFKYCRREASALTGLFRT